MRYLIASPVESWLITCTSSRVGEVGECDHVAIRPSWLVVLVKITSGRLQQISFTAIFAAGFPVVVSRTWQVIGSLAGAVIVDCHEFELVDGCVCR